MSKRRKQHCFWSSMVVLTIIVCGAVLYASYIYEGNHMAPCENCNDMSEILQEKLSQEECQRICYSKECVVAANFILENMDTTADPCEDFYTFSCGKWMRQFSKEDNYSVVDGMTTTLQLTLKDVLEKSKGTPGSTEEKLKIMFDSCMDERASEWNSKSEARKFLEKFGIRNWPNLPNDFQFNVSLDETLSIMAAFNEFAFVTFKPTYDEPQESLADNNFRKLTISPGYPLMRDESESDVYEAVLLGILRHFGASSEDADEIWTEFKTIDFSLLSLLMETSAKVRYGEDEQELLEPLNCLASVEDSMSLTCRVLAKFTEFSNISRRYSGRIAYMEREHYVQNIFSHVTNFTQKSVGNYLALRFIINHQRDLNGFLRALGAELPDVYPLDRNRKGIVPKWEYCTRWMSHYMSYPLGQLYVREVLPEKHMDEIRNVVRIFIYDAGVYVMKQRWVKKHLRRRLKTLIDNIKNSFEDYVRTLRNETKLGLYMDEFSPTSENFLRNVMEYRKLTFQFYLLNHRALEDAEFPAE
ncbi:membrane metallo-endopeptidase-like 1 [Caerostris darwini]|uniref:Membrane metallo-endopeptidase-like 1 n=1 Tax=Caerostris darwini TaxID=1538125 RepID=A0AAV4TNI5_9ARAC|nr:membrane metallo-endopeptidase-like 1 [Caerostris darwini]